MKCDGCKKNEANLVLHMITNGQVATRTLCMECARKAHEEMAQAFSTMGMTLGGMEELRTAAVPEHKEELHLPRMICTSCRTAYENIDQDTVFGCLKCYEAFHDQVIGYLSDLKGQEEPKTVESVSAVQPIPPATEQELRERMEEALKTEDYERAAVLRDRLKEYTGAQEGGQSDRDE